jgi:hypothetical protein
LVLGQEGVTFWDGVATGKRQPNLLIGQRNDARQGWVQKELESADFGDRRLDERFRVVMDDLSEQPSASIPTACGGWAETNAADRFFGSHRVDAEKVLAPHREATFKRIAEHEGARDWEEFRASQEAKALDPSAEEIRKRARPLEEKAITVGWTHTVLVAW